MRKFITTLAMICMISTTTSLFAQPPREGGGRGRGPGGPGGPGAEGGGGIEESVNRLMAFDKNKDGKLSSDELSDTRLKALMERADANKDSIVTKEELTQMLTKESQSRPDAGPGGRGGEGGERGAFGGRGPGGPGMRPGTVMPEFIVEMLKLNEVQKASLAKLQATVDAELAKILTPEQQEQMKQMGQGQRGGRDGGPGREGAGRPDGEGRNAGRPQR